jgi:hypothetical protein
MATQAKCQTLVNTEDDKGEPCGKVATFVVKGRPGYPWFGQHCDAHALDVARHMGHQGGSVIVPIGK